MVLKPLSIFLSLLVTVRVISTSETDDCSIEVLRTASQHTNSSACADANTFILPNGRALNQAAKFCDCRRIFARDLFGNCNMTNDGPRISKTPLPSCNSDGTWNCKVTLADGMFTCLDSRGVLNDRNMYPDCEPEAFCEPACIRYSKEKERFLNSRNCTCILVMNQQMDSSLSRSDNYIPRCNVDGSWKKTQIGYGSYWKVDSFGNQIENMWVSEGKS